MKMILILLTTLFSLNSFSAFYFSPGLALGAGSQSPELDLDNDSPIVDVSGGGGFHMDSELELFWRFSFNLGIQYIIQKARVQYEYTNPEDRSEKTQVDELLTTMTSFSLMPGIRFYILNGKRIKMFSSIGTYSAAGVLTHSEEDFEEKKKSTDGFSETSSASLTGSYIDFGIKYFWNPKEGLQFTFTRIKFESDNFETLGGKSFSNEVNQISILYNHSVNFDFFWK